MFALQVDPNIAKTIALKNGLPYTSDSFAWNEHAGAMIGLFARVPIETTDRILIFGDAFLHLSSNLSPWLSGGSVSVLEPNPRLYAFAEEWKVYHDLSIQMSHTDWIDTNPSTIVNDATWVVLWDITHRISETSVTSILLKLRPHIDRGGKICLKHTSPQYKEQHPESDSLISCPIFGLRWNLACPTFRYARNIAKQLDCSYTTFSSIVEPKTYVTIFEPLKDDLA